MTATHRRVLVVGSGARIRNSFLPALSLLPDDARATALWSRTYAHAEEVADRWGIRAVRELEAVLDEVDTVVMSVSTAANPSVLERLASAAHRLELVIDTPVLRLQDVRSVAALRRFRRVAVAEDYMSFPQWELARRAVAGGLVGPVRTVQLFHSGYMYHGLALIRSLFDFDHPRIVRRRPGPGTTVQNYLFTDGRVGTIVEPYDQSRGRTVIEGDSGVITDDPGLGWKGKPISVITRQGDPGAPTGFSLERFSIELPDVAALKSLDIDDVSEFNTLKTLGLRRAIASLWESSIYDRYSYRSCLHDYATTSVLKRLPAVIDPTAFVGRAALPVRRHQVSPAPIT